MPCCRTPGRAPARLSRTPISSRAGSTRAAIRSRPLPTSAACASRACTGCSGSPSPTPASSTCTTARRRRRRSTPAKAASKAIPNGSGATIPSANGTRSRLFRPPTRLEVERSKASSGRIAVKVISYRHQGKPGVGVVAGKGVVALSKAAPNLPSDLRKILDVDPTLAVVRTAAAGKSVDLSLDDIEFDPVIREPHATWALALNYKLHIEETGLTTSPDYPQIFLRMPISQVGHNMPLWAPRLKIAEAYDYEGELAV